MAEEQGTPTPQDPAAAAPVAPPAEPVQQVGPSPWQQSLQQAFDPQTAAQVDAWARANVQPYVTRREQELAAAQQQYAETEDARKMLDAFNTDADAANVAVNRQLYGDDYANQLAVSLNRNDLLTNQPVQQQQQNTTPQAPAPDPRYEEMYSAWQNEQQQRQYDEAKTTFLQDPQYADIDPELFDVFVGSADTWEDAVGTYRTWSAKQAERFAPADPAPPPPTLGSDASGAPGSTPSVPHESLNDAIDNMFAEQRPAPPTI